MNYIHTGIVLSAALLASSAAVATSTFELFRNDPAAGACTQAGGGGMGNKYDCSATVPGFADELTISAYSTTASGSRFAAAQLGDYNSSGFGVTASGESTSSPQHSMDNNGTLDLILFKFDSSIALESIKAGWFSGDSDMSVLAYTGAGNALTDLTGASQGTLLTTGWSLIGNYADSGTSERAVNSGNVSSSYWIVSAYSSSFGEAWSTGNDYIKLQTVKGTFTCANSNDPACNPGGGQVPEPASFALVAVALAGVAGSRRRRRMATDKV